MKNQYRFMKPPTPIRRAHLDNVGLVPGNLLPQVHRWHQLAGELPKDELVIVLPEEDTAQKKTLTTVADLLQKFSSASTSSGRRSTRPSSATCSMRLELGASRRQTQAIVSRLSHHLVALPSASPHTSISSSTGQRRSSESISSREAPKFSRTSNALHSPSFSSCSR